jgi:hypothetical protein
MTDIEKVRAALDGIGALLDLLECSDKSNLALLPLFLAEQKRALAALTRMEGAWISVEEQVELRRLCGDIRVSSEGIGMRVRNLADPPEEHP